MSLGIQACIPSSPLRIGYGYSSKISATCNNFYHFRYVYLIKQKSYNHFRCQIWINSKTNIYSFIANYLIVCSTIIFFRHICYNLCKHTFTCLVLDPRKPVFRNFAVTYIRVTRNANEIPILNSNNTVGYLTQVNEGNSISFIYTIGFYRYFGIHRVISLLFT